MLSRVTAVALAVSLFVAPPLLASPLTDALQGQLQRGIDGPLTEQSAEPTVILQRFYSDYFYRPLWVTESGALPKAYALAKILRQADRDALDPEDYGASAVNALLGATDPKLLAELEVRLSAGLIQFASDLGGGRVAPRIANPKLFVFRPDVDKKAVLEEAEQATDMNYFVARYRPQTPRYERLRDALARYRAWEEAGGWQRIPEGPVVHEGERDPRVAMLRARLALWGDLPQAAATTSVPTSGGAKPGDVYDPTIVGAVKRMQARHGLAVDGVLGPNTLAALNVPVEQRVAQIMLNLERRRWIPDDLGAKYIFVNLADFALKLVEEPKTVLDMRVVVGKPYHATPVFSEKMTYVVFNPYWNVPTSIARNELLPKIRKDPGYAVRNNYTLLSGWHSGAATIDPYAVDWSRDGGNYRIRQEPGDGNALGRVKFMFPNPFSIYLHDTPAKSLFQKAERDFSHGCIRVEQPTSLAAAVLAGTPGWSAERIAATIASGRRTVVTLANPIPVHISYLTAWVNKDGTVHFRKDIYGRDAELAGALLGSRATPGSKTASRI